MTKISKNYSINDIVKIVKSYNDDVKKKKKSYDYVSKYLEKIILDKCLDILYLLTTVNADSETIAASILSNLFCIDNIKRIDIEKEFGFNVTKLAYNAYKLNSINLSTANDYLIEYYKKVIVGMTEDVRSVIIALAERVYLMHNIEDRSLDEQKRIAKETLEIFAPLAHHLGIYKLKSELEDMALRYLKPDVYYGIVEKLNSTKKERDNIINAMMNEVSNLLLEHNIVLSSILSKGFPL